MKKEKTIKMVSKLFLPMSNTTATLVSASIMVSLILIVVILQMTIPKFIEALIMMAILSAAFDILKKHKPSILCAFIVGFFAAAFLLSFSS